MNETQQLIDEVNKAYARLEQDHKDYHNNRVAEAHIKARIIRDRDHYHAMLDRLEKDAAR